MALFSSKPSAPVEAEVIVGHMVEESASRLPRRLAMGVSILVALFLSFNYAKRYKLIPANLGGEVSKPQFALPSSTPATLKPGSDIQETILKPAAATVVDVAADKSLVVASTGDVSVQERPVAVATAMPVVLAEEKSTGPGVSIGALPEPAMNVTHPSVQTKVMAAAAPAAAASVPAVAVAAIPTESHRSSTDPKASLVKHNAAVVSAPASHKERQAPSDRWQDGTRFF